MEPLLFLLLIGLAIWLQVHSQNARERIQRLEESHSVLQKKLARLEEATVVPEPDAPPATEPDLSSKPSPAPDPAPLPSVSPPPLPSPERPPQHAAPSPPAATTPPAPRRPIAWRSWLEKLKLWPPTGENAEAAIASWWLTRIGLIILIIAAVFFGVRIAEDTPPALRLASLAAISAGVAGLGLWLERRLRAFGRLISAGGLGLGYFTAFAAYGVEATRVIDQAAIGFALQAGAVGVVIAWSFWKKDEALAAMALLLGYVACWFSHAHDLHQFVIAGLLLLAVGGGTMLKLRRWLWPYAVAVVGSWSGFLILGLFEWPKTGAAPPFLLILGSMLGLTMILEIANFATGRADSASPFEKWLRRLALINTSLAVGVGWLAVRMAFPPGEEIRELDKLYLAFAAILGGFAALRYWQHHPVAITETYFLKASGLLALFFVAWFDGPTRWLSLSAQTLVMLWAWRRSGLAWIEAGFGILLATTILLLGYDIDHSHDSSPPWQGWEILSLRYVVGALSLALLTSSLALHENWRRILPRLDASENRLRRAALLIAGFACGGLLTALVTTMTPGKTSPEAVFLISLGGVVISCPGILFRRAAPVVGGLVALSAASLWFLRLPFEVKGTPPALWAGLWLFSINMGAAECARRRWRDPAATGRGARLLLHALGLITLSVTLVRALDGVPPSARLIEIFAFLAFAATVGLVLIRQGAQCLPGPFFAPSVSPTFTQGFLAIIGGALVAGTGLDLLDRSPYQASWIAVAAGVLFATAFITRNFTSAIAGGIPLATAFVTHLIDYRDPTDPGRHLLAAAIIVAVCLLTAHTVRRADSSDRRLTRQWLDAALLFVSLMVIHWIFRGHLSPSQVFAADAAAAFALLLTASLPLALPTQALISPLLPWLGIAHLAYRSLSGHDPGIQAYWWIAAGFIGAWVWAAHRFWDQGNARKSANLPLLGVVATAALALTVAGHQALESPWHLVALPLFAIGLGLLGKLAKMPATTALSLLPIATAIPSASLLIATSIPDSPPSSLLAICLLATLLTAHGVVITWGESRNHRSLTWLHGLIALGLAFAAFATPRLGVDALTTVCWGASAVLLFLIGLVAGLRPYRLAGLIGLALAMVRMFAVDIDDPLYRIYAFFAIALVLLGIGYLYHRYRHLIEQADGRATDGESEKSPTD